MDTVKQSRKIRIIDFVILAVLFSFLFAYLGVSYYNRAMQDDFFFYSRDISLGIFGSVMNYYYHFEGAFADFFWVELFSFINQYSTQIFFINLFNIVLLFTSLFLLLTLIIKELLPYYSVKIPLYLCVLIITSILYFQYDVIHEVVFWFTGSTVYMTTISWFLVGIYFLLKKGPVNLIISAFLLFFFAAVRLHYSLTELGILFYFFLWYFLKNKKINYRIVLVMIIAMAGFAIYLAAPGNYAGRFNASEQEKLLHTPIIFYFKLIAKSLVYYFYVHIFKIFPLLLLNFALAFILGLSDEKNHFTKNTFLPFAKFSIYTLAISWLSIAVVMAVVQQGAGPSRTFFFPLFITMIVMVVFFYFLGIQLKQKFQFVSALTLPLGLIACGYFFYFLFSDLGKLKEFSVKFDQRIETIIRAKEVLMPKDTLFLEKLPYTKSLMNNELRGDFWVTCQQEALHEFYNTPFQIKIVSSQHNK